MPQVRIEAMREHDIEDVLALESATYPAGLGEHVRAERRAASEAHLRTELARPWSRLWVARRASSVAAFLLAWHVADELHVLNVATHPRARRRGLARALLLTSLEFARAERIRLVLLEVRRSNLPAIGLYRSAGFFATAVRPRYYADDEDAIEMALALDPHTGRVVAHPDEVPLDPG